MKQLLFSAFCMLMFVTSCKKSDSDEPKGSMALLTEKGWVNTNTEFYNGNNNTWVVSPALYTGLHLHFYTDGHHEFRDYTVGGNPSTYPVKASGQWAFTDNNTKLLFSGKHNFAYNNCGIDELTASTLKISFDNAGDRYRYTFVHP